MSTHAAAFTRSLGHTFAEWKTVRDTLCHLLWGFIQGVAASPWGPTWSGGPPVSPSDAAQAGAVASAASPWMCDCRVSNGGAVVWAGVGVDVPTSPCLGLVTLSFRLDGHCGWKHVSRSQCARPSRTQVDWTSRFSGPRWIERYKLSM